jgi:MFS family permease
VRGTAYALDATANELVFVAGPTLVAVLSLLAGGAAAVAVAALLGALGTLGIATTPALRQWTPAPEVRTGVFATVLAPGMPRLLTSDFALMTGFGALEVAIPAFASAAGRPGLSGLLLAVWSLGSAAGGLWFGARVISVSLPRQYRWGLLGVTIGLAPLAAVGNPWVLAALLFLGGTAIAPTLTVQNSLVGSIAPAHATTEAFTWLSTIAFGASAVGAAVAGALIDSTWGLSGALGCAAVMAALAVAITLVPGRRPRHRDELPAGDRREHVAA